MKYSDLTINTYTVASAPARLENVAMRITHNPTGLEVEVERPCSRKNKRLAELKLGEMVSKYEMDAVKGIISLEQELAEIIDAVGPVELTNTGCKFKARFTDNFKATFGCAGSV